MSACGVVAVGLVASALPAHAANYTPTCSSGSETSISLAPGATVTFDTNGGNCDTLEWVPGDPNAGYNGGGTVQYGLTGTETTEPGRPRVNVLISNGDTVTFTAPSSGGSYLFFSDNNVSANKYFILSTGTGGGGSSSSSGSTGPAPVPQQFGLPASGTCDEAAPADLNWAGVPSGGWGISWAQWMNDGNGGAVCTRTLSYVGTGWTIN